VGGKDPIVLSENTTQGRFEIGKRPMKKKHMFSEDLGSGEGSGDVRVRPCRWSLYRVTSTTVDILIRVILLSTPWVTVVVK
jgi:hypothetical protein